jgi:hypothetical protein
MQGQLSDHPTVDRVGLDGKTRRLPQREVEETEEAVEEDSSSKHSHGLSAARRAL